MPSHFRLHRRLRRGGPSYILSSSRVPTNLSTNPRLQVRPQIQLSRVRFHKTLVNGCKLWITKVYFCLDGPHRPSGPGPDLHRGGRGRWQMSNSPDVTVKESYVNLLSLYKKNVYKGTWPRFNSFEVYKVLFILSYKEPRPSLTRIKVVYLFHTCLPWTSVGLLRLTKRVLVGRGEYR